jgi:hypothetical protein
MVVIVNNVTSKNDEGDDEVIVKVAKSFERDIQDLLRYAQGSSLLTCITRRQLIANYDTGL